MRNNCQRVISHIHLLISLLLISSVLLILLVIGCGGATPATQSGTGRIRPIPESEQILFLSKQDTGSSRMEIYSMSSSGEGITRITHINEQHFIFGIDPSRRYIVTTQGNESQKRLWLLDLQTGKETPITGEKNNAEGRSFSPDGEWIVFWMVLEGETYSDIYKVKRDSLGLVNLTNTPLAHEFDPAWSNDGDKIAFIYNNGQPNRFVLKVMNTDGTNIETVYDPVDAVNTARFPSGVYDPSWSPDDRWVLVDEPVKYTGRGENGGAGVWHILKVSVDSKIIEDLTSDGVLANSALYLPSFSPDGKWIVASLRQGPEDVSQTSLEIVKMTSDGSNIERLTNSPYWEQFPVWVR